MAGGTNGHNFIAINIISELRARLHAPCRVLNSDAKLEIYKGSVYVFPDAMVICHPDDLGKKNTWNRYPSLVVEVLSDSTKDYDRGSKRDYYFSLPSVQYYMLVSQDEYRVEVYERQGKFWQLGIFTSPDDVLDFQLLGVWMTVGEVYRDVTF
jgi:Uma2 family endonuclease